MKLRTFIAFGKNLADLSACKIRGNACLVFPVDCSEILAIGFNGPAIGLPHDSCTGEKGNCSCAHAEANAIAKLGRRTDPLLIYTTSTPCMACANLILNCLAIKGMIYSRRSSQAAAFEMIEQHLGCVESKKMENSLAKLHQWRSLRPKRG